MDLGLLLKHTEIQQEQTENITNTSNAESQETNKVVSEHTEDTNHSVLNDKVSFSGKVDIIEPVKDTLERFRKPWNKLEKGMKMNRLLIFIDKENEDNMLSPELKKELKTILFKACDSGCFNKLSEVSYDVEEATITSIKSLEFNSETKRYKIRSGSSKHRSTSKSKSNIDRLLKPKSRTK